MDAGQALNCHNHWGAIIAFIWLIHSVFEYWLGKTNKTKAASTWELLFSVAIMFVLFLLRRKKNAKSSDSNGSSEGM